MDGRRRSPKCVEGGTFGCERHEAESPLGKEPPCPDVCLSLLKEVSLRPLPCRGRQRAWGRVWDEGAWGPGWWAPHVDQGPGQRDHRQRGRQRAEGLAGRPGGAWVGSAWRAGGKGRVGLAGTWPKDRQAT